MTTNLLGAGALVGVPVRRIEDPALLRGQGTYIDNLRVQGMLHLAFVRSSVAHARIVSIDTSEAEAMPGVVGVFTSEDLDLPDFVGMMQLNPGITYPPLARGTVRYVGDRVAVVAATSKAEAVDAIELVIVDYDPLPVVADSEAALAPGASLQVEELGTNLVMGMREPDDFDPLDDAEVVVRGRFENQRVAVVPMEGAAVAVLPGDDGEGHELTVYLTSQMPHNNRAAIARQFGIEPERVRVITPDVGGSFGGKHWSPEGSAAVGVARALGRPVKWVETRSENLLALPHARDQVQYVELGLRRDGTITGMRCRVISDAGAYAGFGGALAIGPTRMMAQAVYRIPKLGYDVAAVMTNRAPLGGYRGAGRPEATAMVERIIDLAADELGIDPIEIRRRNFVQPDEFPYTTVTGVTYDSGDYDLALTEVLRLAGYDELRAEQARRRDRADTTLLGIGVSAYVEITAPGMGEEYASVAVNADGTVTLMAGTSAHGQGHATTFSQLASGQLGIPIEQFTYVQSDTARVPRGSGTGGSRSLQTAGSATLEAARLVVEQAKQLAADLLEASVDDIVAADGGFSVAGVPARTVRWDELARTAEERGESLAAAHVFSQQGSTFPFGAHVSVVEVDTETGRVVPIRHIAVDDCGRVINPLLAAGQVHGGLASGMAQALWEQMVYDEDGNPITTTLAEYAIPSAAELPSFEVAHTETASPLNPLGAKGIGESGTIGSTPAVQNAVVDALSHLGVRHIDMPLTPERVWREIEAARAGRPTDPWREPPAGLRSLPVVPRKAPEAASEAPKGDDPGGLEELAI